MSLRDHQSLGDESARLMTSELEPPMWFLEALARRADKREKNLSHARMVITREVRRSWAPSQATVMTTLPSYSSLDAAIRALETVPPVDDSRWFPARIEHRLSKVSDVNQVLVPTQTHGRVLLATAEAARHSQYAAHTQNPGMEGAAISSRSIKLRLTGQVCAGRTSLLNAIKQKFEPAQCAPLPDELSSQRQIPMLVLRVRDEVNLKHLCRIAVNVYDDHYGTFVFEQLYNRESSTEECFSIFLHRLRLSNTFIVLIDDWGRDRPWESTSLAVNALCDVLEYQGIATISSETSNPRSRACLPEAETLMKRGYEVHHLGDWPFDNDFVRLCETLWRYRISHRNLDMPEFFPETLHALTEGRMQAFTRLIKACFQIFLENEINDRPITPDTIKKAATRLSPLLLTGKTVAERAKST